MFVQVPHSRRGITPSAWCWLSWPQGHPGSVEAACWILRELRDGASILWLWNGLGRSQPHYTSLFKKYSGRTNENHRNSSTVGRYRPQFLKQSHHNVCWPLPVRLVICWSVDPLANSISSSPLLQLLHESPWVRRDSPWPKHQLAHIIQTSLHIS